MKIESITAKKEKNMHLIHPIYLDVPMLVSFAAAIQGGLSLESDVTREKEANKSGSAKLEGKFGVANLFKSLFDVTVGTELAGEIASRNQETRHELKSHTEASVAIILYDEFRKKKEYLTIPGSAAELVKVDPGTLIEIAGTIEKNAIDAMIDYIDAVGILSNLGGSLKSGAAAPLNKQVSGKKDNRSHQPVQRNEPIQQISLKPVRDTLDRDRKRTPMANMILRCKEPLGINVIVTLRTANLRDLTLTELHKNSVRVVGKVTRIIDEGQTMSAFENYGMSLIKPEILEESFNKMRTGDVVAEFSEVEIKGPAVQVLPLMIFV